MGSTGYFELGTVTKSYLMKCSIALVGSDPSAVIPGHRVSSKAIMVMNGSKNEFQHH
ncbi:MAG: hypothetical protein H7329_00385 [Opitutaceae bacterium]|nr:hypothetical protein [Cytophagales bacterium]